MIAIVIVDHGSRRADSNDAFVSLVRRFAEQSRFEIVEPAHMDLAPPTIDDAFARAVSRGANQIVVQPFFLLPGRHLSEDIPRLCNQAARRHGAVAWRLTGALCDSDEILGVIAERIDAVLG